MVVLKRMPALLTLGNVLWGTTTFAEVVLLVLLLRRKLAFSRPVLALYVASTILQSILAVFVYATWGIQSPIASKVIWGSQGIVISLRFLAVYEMARRILSPFEGIWTLARRILMLIGLSTLAYSLLSSQQVYRYLILNLDRGLELCIAIFIVVMLVFARYYYLPLAPLDRALCIGFCLYSCVYVINDSLLERYWNVYQSFWSYLGIVSFLASLLMWIRAVNGYSVTETSIPKREALPSSIYGSLSPEFNFRLKLLNDQLTRLFRFRKQRS